MYVKKIWLILFVLSIYSFIIYGTTYTINESNRAYDVILTSQSKDSISINVTLSKFVSDEIVEDDSTYSKITIPDIHISSSKNGYPEFPIIKVLVALPEGYSINGVVESDKTYEEYSLGKVYPSQKDYFENEEKPPFYIDLDYYNSDQDYPSDNIEISEINYFRKIRFVELRYIPFIYSPSEKSLSAISNANIKLELYKYDEPPKHLSSKKVKRSKDDLNKKLFINYNSNFKELDTITVKDNRSIDLYDILVIVPDKWQSNIQQYMGFKKACKWKIKAIPYSSPTTTSWVKTKIEEEYYLCGIEYAILVGDETDIPMIRYDWVYHGFNKRGAPSDFMFGLIEGNDETPEVLIGRFSVSNGGELENMSYKLQNFHFYKNTTLIAHKEGSPGKYEGCCETIANATYTTVQPSFIKVYGSKTGIGNDDITSAYNNENNGIIMYRGHGMENRYTQAWSIDNPDYTVNDAQGMGNKIQFPVLLNICCCVGAIDWLNGNCFTEVITRMPNGVSLTLAATRASFTIENSGLAILLFKEIFDKDHNTLGEAYYSASMAQSLYIGDFSSYNRRIYSWFPDPSLGFEDDVVSIEQNNLGK